MSVRSGFLGSGLGWFKRLHGLQVLRLADPSLLGPVQLLQLQLRDQVKRKGGNVGESTSMPNAVSHEEFGKHLGLWQLDPCCPWVSYWSAQLCVSVPSIHRCLHSEQG